MSNPPKPSESAPSPVLPSPLNCLGSAAIAAGLGLAVGSLTWRIVNTFAATPLPTSSPLATNLSGAIRTLVVGLGTLATGICGMVAVGLVALALQVALRGSTPTGQDQSPD